MKWILACLAILVVPMLIPAPANAEGGPSSGYISPKEQARAAQKAAELRRWVAEGRPTPGGGVSTAALFDYSEVTMSLWQEPQTFEARNWCGPGSTTAVVGQWRGNAYVDNYSDPRNGLGPDAYQAHLARCTAGDYCQIVNQETSWDNYLRVVNAETLSSFYVQDAVGGQARYNDMLSLDIYRDRHPLAPVVDGYLLPGWNRHVAHFVTVKQYWISGDTTTYGDTAGLSQGRNMGANWNVVSLTDFYQVHIQPITQYSFDRIVW